MADTTTTPAVAVAEGRNGPIISGGGKIIFALLRIALGFTYFWACIDKVFGLGYSTPSDRAVIHGGSATKGFLSSIKVGPFQDFFHSIAGSWWADLLFLVGLGAIGAAFILGAGIRIAAWTGALLMLMMWAAEWPMDTVTSAGTPSGSTNPFVDYHLIYALAGLALMSVRAGRWLGLGGWWSRTVGPRSPLL